MSKVKHRSKVRCPTLQVVINLARQQPLSVCLWDHLSCCKCGREQAEDVSAVTAVQQSIPMEKGRMNIYLITHANQMPGYCVVLA